MHAKLKHFQASHAEGYPPASGLPTRRVVGNECVELFLLFVLLLIAVRQNLPTERRILLPDPTHENPPSPQYDSLSLPSVAYVQDSKYAIF